MWPPLPGSVIGINCPGLFDPWAVGALPLPAQLGDPQGTVTPAQTSSSFLRHGPHPCSELDSAGIASFGKLYPLKTAAERNSELEKGDLRAGIGCRAGSAPNPGEGEEKPWGVFGSHKTPGKQKMRQERGEGKFRMGLERALRWGLNPEGSRGPARVAEHRGSWFCSP